MISKHYPEGAKVLAKYDMYAEFEPATVKSCRKHYDKDSGSVRVVFDDPLEFPGGSQRGFYIPRRTFKINRRF